MSEQLGAVVARFSSLSVLVIGDCLLDVYLHGQAARLCREGPVPVVDVHERAEAPGGAANAAVNLAQLGAQVTALLVIGGDAAGTTLSARLAGHKVEVGYLAVERSRDTPVKHRLMADGGLVARFDEGRPQPMEETTERRVLGWLRELAAGCDAILVSDYGYGVLSPAVIRCLSELRRSTPATVVVDAHDLLPYRGAGMTAATPNYEEAIRLLGLPPVKAAARAGQLGREGDRIPAMLGASTAAVTLDADGALLFEPGRPPYRTYARAVAGPATTGRGDTYAATLALGLAAGADVPSAGEIAGLAAGLAAAGGAERHACTAADLCSALAGQQRMVEASRLAEVSRLHRQRGQRVVFTNGCFDILHSGHVSLLNRAKALGDVLIVAVNSDTSVRRLKGSGRPINTLSDRLAVLGALSCVDYLISFEEETPAALIDAVQPDIFVKGGDYQAETLPEGPLLRSIGTRVEILPLLPDRSTTGLVERIWLERPAGMKAAH
jgi:D-beta-D-heptose 7-phosphate kinase/D-beta-D-heptose 1-phosphate adenosyltransferase